MQHDAHIHSGGEIGSFFSRLFSASDFTPRAVCFNEDPQVIVLHFVSDLVITLAYYSIPIALIYLVMKRRDLVFNWMFVLFGGFILLCGTTHLFNIIALTTPVYRLDGVIKALTAGFSIATAAALWPLIPKALALPSQAALREANTRLESEVREKQAAQDKLQSARDELEQRVQERTAELNLHRERLAELVQQRTRELEASHQQLRVSERMAAIGTLSAGLGHDMGNLLLPVRARLDAIEGRLDGLGVSGELGEDLLAIRTSAEYLQRLARGLRLLALDPNEGGGETELTDWWNDVGPMLENVLPRGVELHVEIPSDLPPAQVARHGLTQAVFNLVQNAGDALRAGGGRVEVWARMGRDPSTVEVGVTDNGPGMTEEVRQRCVEPFFTTKTRAISTGLGLTLVHGIVQRAGGTLHIESEPGKGCTFVLRLHASARSSDSDRAPAPGRVAAVTIADGRIRSFTEGLLKALGYQVVHGQPSDQAQLWITEPTQIELVRRFVDGSGDRRAVIFGSAEAEEERILVVPDPGKPILIRRALQKAAGQA